MLKDWAGISGFLSFALLLFQAESANSQVVIAVLFGLAMTLYGISSILDLRSKPRVKALAAANQVLERRCHRRTF